MVVLESKSSPSANDIVFVVEGTALCGAYLNEVKQSYILPTLEHFNGGPVDEKECGSASNYAIYGLVVFHAADILPGYLTEAYGPITTGHKLLTTLDKIQFAGGYGEAASHVGEGLATALQCLEDISSFRNPPPEVPAKKHIILICNCKPYGLPVTESVGTDGVYRGMTAEQLASQMQEKNVHLSIMAPRKIPALISLFDKSGGESSSQKTYARDVRHLVLLNGFQLQERPITPKQVPEVPAIMNPPPPTSAATTQAQQPHPPQVPTPTSANQPMPHPPPTSMAPSPQVPMSMPSQPPPQPMQQQQQQQQPTPQPNVPPPPPPVQVPPPQPIVSSHAPMMMSTASSIAPQTSMHPTSMAMSSAPSTVSMAQSQAGNVGSPMMGMNQPPNMMGMNMHPGQQPNQQMILIRNRAGTPLQQMQNIRQMQMQTQQMNPNQMGHQLNAPGGPQQQLQPGQQMNPSQMMNTPQSMAQVNMSQQQQMNQQLNQQLQNQNQPMTSQMGQFPNQMNQQMTSQSMNQQMPGQPQMTTSILGPRMMSAQLPQQQQNPQISQSQLPQAPQTTPNMGRWPGPMVSASSIQKMQQTQVPLVRMSNVNQPQVPSSIQPLQAQMSVQQPILSTGIQPSALQQQLQQNQPQTGQQPPQQPTGHSTLLAQLKNPPIGAQQQQQPPHQQPPQQPTPQPTGPGGMLTAPPPAVAQKERQTIWTGTLEWHEKQKGPPDGQKVPRQVPCKVSASVVNGEAEVKGDGWPQKLIMQLIPKNIVGSLGGSYLARDVKTVVFMLQPCDALNSLTRVMDSGYAGCVHFTGGQGMQQAACNIKVLILLYSKERQTYLGFIPNDQVGFVDRIRKVIQQQKQQQTSRQGQVGFPGAGGMPNAGLMPGQQPGPGMVNQQQPGGMVQAQPGMVQQQGMGQPQQTPISSLAQQLGQTPQTSMGQSPVAALAQQLGQAQQNLAQLQQQQQQQQMQNPGMGGNMGNMDGGQSQQDINLESSRQENLRIIQQLQQTLQAAQQKELQFQQVQQLHQHVPQPGPPNQIQLQVGQQQQIMQGGPGQQQIMQGGPGQQQIMQGGPGQQQIMQGGPGQQQMMQGGPGQQIPRQMMTPQAMNQMRMMRPSVSQANPGLKHLLQQQPGPQTYRMQIPMQQQRMVGQMGMPGQMQGPGGPMQQNQQQMQQQQQQFDEVGILDLLK